MAANQIAKIRAAKELTLEQLAEASGVSVAYLSRIERGERRLNDVIGRKIARGLGVHLADLLAPSDAQFADKMGVDQGPLPNIGFGGIVEAGAFRQQDLYVDDPRDIVVVQHAPRVPGYPGVAQLGYVVRGDSMDAAGILPGMVVVALAFGDYVDRIGSIRDGDIVVVRRTRGGGHEVELTIKEFRDFPDRIELLPRSRNVAHAPIVVAKNDGADDGTEVKIEAVVRYAGFVFDGSRR